MEIWKEIENYDNYQISNYGVIKNKKGDIIKQTLESNGYYRVGLCKNGKQTKHCLHRLLAIAFIENKNTDYTEIDHIDSNPQNNNIENLRWVNRSINNLNKKYSRNAKHIYPNGGGYVVNVKYGGKTYTKKIKDYQEAIQYRDLLLEEQKKYYDCIV